MERRGLTLIVHTNLVQDVNRDHQDLLDLQVPQENVGLGEVLLGLRVPLAQQVLLGVLGDTLVLRV